MLMSYLECSTNELLFLGTLSKVYAYTLVTNKVVWTQQGLSLHQGSQPGVGVGGGGGRPSYKDLYLKLPEKSFSLPVPPYCQHSPGTHWVLPSSLALGCLAVKHGSGTPVPNSQRYNCDVWIPRRQSHTVIPDPAIFHLGETQIKDSH